MLDKERLIKAPTITAEEVNDDDYILIDSPTLGTRKYLASKLLPEPEPPIEYLWKWDFTKETDPLIDEIQGLSIILNNGATLVQGQGVFIDSATEYIGIPFSHSRAGLTIEIDVGNMEWKHGTSHGRFLCMTDSGLIFRNGNHWQVYNIYDWTNNTVSFADANNGSAFENSTVKVVYGADSSYKYYRNDELVWFDGETTDAGGSGYNIGSRYGSVFYDMQIKAIRIYETIEEE